MLNQCPPAEQTARVQDGAEALEEMGELISPLILTRVDYQEAARHGWGVTELSPYGAAAQGNAWSLAVDRASPGASQS